MVVVVVTIVVAAVGSLAAGRSLDYIEESSAAAHTAAAGTDFHTGHYSTVHIAEAGRSHHIAAGTVGRAEMRGAPAESSGHWR